MVIKIIELGIVRASDINYTDSRVANFVFGWFPSVNWYTVQVTKQAAGQKIVFVCTAGVSDDKLDFHGCFRG